MDLHRHPNRLLYRMYSPPNRLYARYTATSIPFQYINPSFFCKIQLLCPHIHFLSKYTFVVRRRAGIVAPVMQLLQRTPP